MHRLGYIAVVGAIVTFVASGLGAGEHFGRTEVAGQYRRVVPMLAGDSAPGPFQAVALGLIHSCAIRTSGELVCWGSNGSQESTPPSGSFKRSPVREGYE